MKLRYLLILGILVFLNGFVFTVLLLMVSREMARPVDTPTAAITMVPTLQPSYTSTAAAPSPTPTSPATATSVPQPAATSTLVIPPATATYTSTPIPPTATMAPATATNTPGTPTSTSVPPTATATIQPTATPTSYEFAYAGGMLSAPNCGSVYMEGKITGVGGEAVSGRTVRLRFADNVFYRVSGEDGKPPGEWGFSPLAQQNFHSPFTFLIDIVVSPENPVAQSDTAEISFTDCGIAGQFTNIVFAYAQ